MKHTRIIVRYGANDALQVLEEECPEPKNGEVRVRVLAAGVFLGRRTDARRIFGVPGKLSRVLWSYFLSACGAHFRPLFAPRPSVGSSGSMSLRYQLRRLSLEAAIGIEPMNKGFADLCLTTWLRRHTGEHK
jgi:hypothetical protein